MLVKGGLAVMGGGSIVYLLLAHVLPFLAHNPDLVFPFAVANGVTAASLYAIGDLML